MIIRYEFVNGEISEIEVDDYYGEILKEFNRNQRNSNRVYRRHNYSLEAALYQGKDFGYNECFTDLLEEVDTLTETELRRLKKYVSGYSIKEIADQEGVSTPAILYTLDAARKKIKNY